MCKIHGKLYKVLVKVKESCADMFYIFTKTKKDSIERYKLQRSFALLVEILRKIVKSLIQNINCKEMERDFKVIVEIPGKIA